MKKNILLQLMLLIPGFYSLKAQVTLNLQLLSDGLTTKNQLWNLSLVNAGSENIDVKIEMELTDVRNNQRVLTGTTKIFSLPHGVKLLQYADIMPVLYNAPSGGYYSDPSPNGFLPAGTFNICFTIIKINNDYGDRLTDQCETVEIEPLSPPQLVSPADSAKVDIKHPLFTWLPPAPYNLFNNLLYDWLLVEVQPVQSPAAAIQQNIPLFQQQNIALTNFQYPLSAAALDTGKVYAWRVTAKSSMLPIANSEIWTFRLANRTIINNSPSFDAYTKLKRDQEAAFAICTGQLHFQYLNERNDTKAIIRIYDITNAVRRELQFDSTEMALHYGQNLLNLDLSGNKDFINKHIYLVELINGTNENWFMKFEFHKPE